ncbi:dihydroorotase [Chitinimonas sp. PSY-7]|uniref:dihydroorotase n=1 Tax=Chitinimonas sp. PSY-7 TaxID=3459088 RepID=UPI00404027B4
MNPETLLIRNARLVNEGQIQEADLLVESGRIAKIAASITGIRAQYEIDAQGQWLLPGMIDDQVHFREPGLTHKGSIASESRAAVAGGITSFMDMPNSRPGTLNQAALQQKLAIAAQDSVANYAFHFGVSRDNLEEVARLDPRTVSGVKVFMGASTGNMLVDDPAVLDKLFANVPVILFAHCEHTPTILARTAEYRERAERRHHPLNADDHPSIRHADACYLSSKLAVSLARKHGTRLHVLHISTQRELSLFEPGPLNGKQITAEACIHHLYFDQSRYADLGNRLKCNPAIKTRADRFALQQAVRDGRLDVIGTDHAPHTLEEKNKPYLDAPAGLPLVQHAMPALMQLVNDAVFDIGTVVAKTSHRVADLFQIEERGYLREGYWADLCLLEYLPIARPVTQDPILYKCGWTPFAAESFNYRVRSTVVSGQLAWHEGALLPGCLGRQLAFRR